MYENLCIIIIFNIITVVCVACLTLYLLQKRFKKAQKQSETLMKQEKESTENVITKRQIKAKEEELTIIQVWE